MKKIFLRGTATRFLSVFVGVSFLLGASWALGAPSQADSSVKPSSGQKKKGAKDKASASSKSSPKKTTEAAKDKDKPAPLTQTLDADSILGKMALTVQGYYSAKSPKDKLAFVLDPKETEPLMREYYFREALLPGTVVQMSAPEAFALQGISFWRTQIALNDGRTGILALRIIEGIPKVDWASEVRYSTQDWQDWLEKGTKGEVGDFRVYAEVDDYYPAPFENREKYLCLKLRTIDSPETVFAYLDLKDEAQAEFAAAFLQNKMMECVLSLKIVGEHKGGALVRVVKVVSPSWIIPHTACRP